MNSDRVCLRKKLFNNSLCEYIPSTRILKVSSLLNISYPHFLMRELHSGKLTTMFENSLVFIVGSKLYDYYEKEILDNGK